MKSRRLSALLAFAALSLTSCVTDMQGAQAELATYRWAGPMLQRYVSSDPTLDEAAKASHLRGIDAWRQRAELAAKPTGGL